MGIWRNGYRLGEEVGGEHSLAWANMCLVGWADKWIVIANQCNCQRTPTPLPVEPLQ